MNHLFQRSLLLGFTFMSGWMMGQSHTHQDLNARMDTSSLRLSLGYASDYYYQGRSDTMKVPYLTSALGFYHASGLFARTGLSYQAIQGDARIDLVTVTAGYRKTGRVLDAGVQLSRYFFHEKSAVVQAETGWALRGFGGYDLSWVMVYVDAGLTRSDRTDGFTGVEVNRTLYAFNNRLRMIPAMYFNWGTLHYYDAYYSNRRSRGGNVHGGNGQGQVPITSVAEASKFDFVNYEAEWQMMYAVKKIRLYMSLVWTFPVHPVTLIDDQGNTYQEELQTGFYWTSGLRYVF